MSTVYTSTVVVAGTASNVTLFEALLDKEGATCEDENFKRNVLATDEDGRPTAVDYRAMTSRVQPELWYTAQCDEAAQLGLATLHLLYEEQGAGKVGVSLGHEVCFANLDIYGYDEEGLAEARKAQALFSKIAAGQFGVQVELELFANAETADSL